VFCKHCHRRHILDAAEAISTDHDLLYEWLSSQESQIEAEICTSHMPFLRGSYGGYNFVSYRQVLYAIPTSLGPFDITNRDSQSHPEVLEIDQFGLLQKLIDHIKSVNSSNIKNVNNNAELSTAVNY